MNTDAPWPTLPEAEARVLGIQTKLHRWATDDPGRRFDDLSNLVADPAFLVVAWDRVRGNRGARSAGVDGVKPDSIVFGTALCEGLRAELKARTFSPMPVRERLIPKAGGKVRRLGIATARDRVVQASLKLVLEPIFEADFKPVSYGFRPKRRAHDAIAEIRLLASNSYEWVLEGDITACFDEIDHTALMGRVRDRIGDKRVLGLVKAFLKAGILSEDGVERDNDTGTPQGGILSPLLANVALSVLDEHFAGRWDDRVARAKRRRHGLANYRIIRYADDFVVMVSGTRAHAEALHDEVAGVLAPMGLRLSEEKTKVAHIDDGLDFLGWRIQRHQKRGGTKRYVYTYPAKKGTSRLCVGGAWLVVGLMVAYVGAGSGVWVRRGEEFGDLVGEAFGGGAAESGGDDDCSVGAAEADEPGPVGWPSSGGGGAGVDLDGDGCGVAVAVGACPTRW